MPSLIVVGKKRTEEFPLTEAVTVIGRDKGVNLELSDFKASRRHALLVQTEVGCFVKDLGSRNGVCLNKTRLTSRGQLPVKNGDVISLGSTTLVFKDLSEAEAGEVTAPTALDPPSGPVPVRAAATPPQPNIAKPPSAVLRPPATPRPALRGEAESLLMQALERADRERSFYRWLSLGLIAVLVIVLLLLLVVALRSPSSSTPATQPSTADSTPAANLPSAAFALDPQRYADAVHPVLSERCASCHANAGRGGGLVLVDGDGVESVRANRLAASRYVIAGHPDHSPLLLRATSPDHAGGVILREDDPAYAQLYAWVTTPPSAGSTPPPPAVRSTNAAPAVEVAAPSGELAAGQALQLDASASSDPDGDALHFRWVISARPAGSQANLDGAAAPTVSFTPDVAGDYEATVIVHDGQDSQRKAIPFRVGLGLAARADARLTVFERLTQRDLDPAERERLEGLSREELATQLLAERGFFDGWWEAELKHLGLTGSSRPSGEPWDSMPTRLQRAANSPIDVLFALAVGSKWNRRYSGREAFVTAVLDRLLAADVDPATREAAAKLYDGFEATYLGAQGTSSADLVKITLDDPRALEGIVRRGLTWIGQRAPSEPDVREVVGWTGGKPEQVFSALARWASRDL